MNLVSVFCSQLSEVLMFLNTVTDEDLHKFYSSGQDFMQFFPSHEFGAGHRIVQYRNFNSKYREQQKW